MADSLDGYIAGPKGEADWIIMDADFDFRVLFSQFDTILLGRRTFEPMAQAARGVVPGMTTLVFSRTLQQGDYPGVSIVTGNPEEALTSLRAKPGKDVWLFGGGVLFRSFPDARLVDTVEVTVMPVPAPAKLAKLKLTGHTAYKTGVTSLEYAIP